MTPKRRAKNGQRRRRTVKAPPVHPPERKRKKAETPRKSNPSLAEWLEQVGPQGNHYDLVLLNKHEAIAKLSPPEFANMTARAFLMLMTRELDRRRMGSDGSPDSEVPPGLYEAACEAVGVLVGAREPSTLSKRIADLGRGAPSKERIYDGAVFRELAPLVDGIQLAQKRSGVDFTSELIATIQKRWPNANKQMDAADVRAALTRTSFAGAIADVAILARITRRKVDMNDAEARSAFVAAVNMALSRG